MAKIILRTADELNDPGFNYFVLLKLDLNETNEEVIKKTINKYVSALQLKQDAKSERIRQLLNDIKQVMIFDATCTVDAAGEQTYVPNSGGRAKEAANAKKVQLKDAIDVLKVYASVGYIEESQLEEIAKSKKVNVNDLKNEIKHLFGQGLELRTSVGNAGSIYGKFKVVDDLLGSTGKKNLYDLIDADENTPVAELLNKCQALYDANFGKKTAAGISDLCAHAKAFFGQPEAKRRYDIFYKVKESVWDSIFLLSKSNIKHIDEVMVKKFIDTMVGIGIPVKYAEEELKAYLLHFNMSHAAGEKFKLATCPHPNCGKVYIVKSGMKHCPSCGGSLELKCWNCGGIISLTTGSGECSTCHVTTKGKNELENAQKELSIKLSDVKTSEVDLIKILNRMENVFPAYEKQPTYYVSRAIADAKRSIDAFKKDKTLFENVIKKGSQDIASLMAQKKFCTASNDLKQLKIKAPSFDTKDMEAKIAAALKTAQTHLDQANAFLKVNNEAKAIESASKALEVCSDYMAAVQVLKKYPPKAPKKITAVPGKGEIKLDWETEGMQNAITYKVVKKVGAAPTSADDGEVIGNDLSISFIQDDNVISGAAYYYGVAAVRGGICSPVTVTSNPVAIFLDVFDVHQEIAEGAIKATWSAPHNVKAVEVYRKTGPVPPMGRADGERIPTTSNTEFNDTTCEGDNSSYLILCKYDCLGREYYSKGIRVSFRKYRFPRPLTNIGVESTSSLTDFVFSCSEPQNGSITLYTSDKRLDLRYGEIEPNSNLNKNAKRLNKLDTVVMAANKLSFSLPENQMIWIYPVISNEQLHIINQPIVVNTVKGIENINLERKGNNVMIKADVDSHVKNIIAVLNNERFEKNLTEGADRRTCSYDAFRNDGGFMLSLSPGTHYVTLFCEFKENGKTFYSCATPLPEVIDNREKIVVQYAINQNLSATNAYKVKIDFMATSPITLPAVDMVRGFPSPMKKSNGQIIYTLEEASFKKKLFKENFYCSVTVTVDPAATMRDKTVLFMHNDNETRYLLKEVKSIK